MKSQIGIYLVEILGGGPRPEWSLVEAWLPGEARTLAWIGLARRLGIPACDLPQAFGEVEVVREPEGMPPPDAEDLAISRETPMEDEGRWIGPPFPGFGTKP